MSPTQEELLLAQQFERRAFADGSEPPFSFFLDSAGSASLLPRWEYDQQRRELDINRTEIAGTWTEAVTRLVVKCVAVTYHDFPVIEWTVTLRNDGTSDAPLISALQGLDTTFPVSGPSTLIYNMGSTCTATDFRPENAPLELGAEVRLASDDGRSSGYILPYFHVVSEGDGLMLAVGWPGQWAINFARCSPDGLAIRAGQEQTSFRLHAGEEVRTPLTALLFYRGDAARGRNLWRRWMRTHNVPKDHGKPLEPMAFACSSHQTVEMQEATEENQQMFVRRYLEEKLPLDFWWMDAGWYVNGAESWTKTGTWEVDKNRFPNGLGAISDYAHARGVKALLWFEPERVADKTWLVESHPEWILTHHLLNLGNPEARQWMTDRVDSILSENRIDLYRQDFNMAPLDSWREADTEDRQGLTENHHVTGYLAYWDELKRRHPDLLFDSCASGGRRLDLESMRRAVPRTRSDYQFEPVGQQNLTYGLAHWLPYYGNGLMDSVTYKAAGQPGGDLSDQYLSRSMFFPVVISSYDVRRDDLPYEDIRRYMGEWRTYAPLMLADYYPLTEYSPNNDVWMAWQFDDPEAGVGMVQAYRRAGNGEANAVFQLQCLSPESHYAVQNLDSSEETVHDGETLMIKGLAVVISAQPGAALMAYRRI